MLGLDIAAKHVRLCMLTIRNIALVQLLLLLLLLLPITIQIKK